MTKKNIFPYIMSKKNVFPYIMTKNDAVRDFKMSILPCIIHRYGKEKVAIRCGWNDYVDYLQKDGRITEKQAKTWTNPFSK